MIKDKKSNCMFCSLGCGFIIRTEDGRPRELDYDFDNPVNKGSLCPRGNYMLELLNSPARLEGSSVKVNGAFYSTTFEMATSEVAGRLSGIMKENGAGSIGMVVGANLFNEEIAFCIEGAKSLGITSVDVALPLEDSVMLSSESSGFAWPAKRLSVKDIEDQDALLIVGDVLLRSPVTSKMINSVKYGKRGSKIIVVDPERSHTSWFSTRHLRVKPGTEPLLICGMIKAITDDASGGRPLAFRKYFEDMDLGRISERTGVALSSIVSSAKEFLSAKKGAVLLVSGVRDNYLMEMANVLCRVSGDGKGIVPFYAGGNSLGAYKLRSVLKSPRSSRFPEIVGAASASKIKALLLVGVDLLRMVPTQEVKKALSNLEFIAAADVYRTSVMDYADAIIPLSSHLEGEGSVVYSGERLQGFKAVTAPAASMGGLTIMSKIFSKMKGGKGKPGNLNPSAIARRALSNFRRTKKVTVSSIVKEVGGQKMQKQKEFPFLVVPKDDIVHSADGSVTSRHYWAARECGIPYAEINVEDCRALSIADGSRVLLKTKRGEVILIAKASLRWQKGIISVPPHFQEIREIADIGVEEGAGAFRFFPFAGALEMVG